MTVFTMPACAKKTDMVESLRRLLLFVAFLVFASVPAKTDDAGINYARIALSEEGYVLNADFSFDLNPKLVDALEHGVALHFVTELRIERPRWYWFNRLIVHRRLEYRLVYHAMTRSYRLNIGSLHRNFDSLADAVYTMQHIRNLYVAPSDALSNKDRYEVTLRFFHNTALLPKPFQLSALANGKWDLDTGWTTWSFAPEMKNPEEAKTVSAKEGAISEVPAEEAMPEVMVTE
jgi:hypothetical protein